MANTFSTIQIKRSATSAAPVSLANGEFGYSFVANTLFIGGPTGTPIAIASNTEFFAANIANNGLTNIAANGILVTSNVSRLNYNNTATMNVAATANGTGTDVAWSANLTAIAGGVNNFQVDILANGSLTLGNANINFNNTSTVNVAATANGTGQANIAFSVNTSAITNVISLNVSSNISNAGNLLVTQNIAAGNIALTQNGSFGNINVTGISANVKQNLVTGNLVVTQNTTEGNLTVTTLATIGNITMNGVSFIPAWTAPTFNSSGTTAQGQNCFSGTVTGSDGAGYWIDPFQIVHLRGSVTNGGGGNIALYGGSPVMNSNIANGFPVPSANVFFTVPAIATGNSGAANVCLLYLGIYNAGGNAGALRMINVAFANGQPTGAAGSWNVANLSIHGITYSRI